MENEQFSPNLAQLFFKLQNQFVLIRHSNFVHPSTVFLPAVLPVEISPDLVEKTSEQTHWLHQHFHQIWLSGLGRLQMLEKYDNDGRYRFLEKSASCNPVCPVCGRCGTLNNITNL